MSLPYDIRDNKSAFNLNPARVIMNKPATKPKVAASPVASGGTTTPLGASALEKLYEATDGGGKFDKVVDFLGTMAEAESFKGKKTYNESSSASGIFHFLVGNGGGHDKQGQKTKYGQYDAKGVLRTSSFETAKKRLRVMMKSPTYSDTIAKQPGLINELNTVLSADNPEQLSPQRQAILAYANLKMYSKDFEGFLKGTKEASDVYGKVWVTNGGTHTNKDIKTNWNNAIARSGGSKDTHYSFFGISPSKLFGGKPASPNIGESSIPQVYDYAQLGDGGTFDEKVISKKTLI